MPEVSGVVGTKVPATEVKIRLTMIISVQIYGKSWV